MHAILDKHFSLSIEIKSKYPKRNDMRQKEEIIKLCEELIKISPEIKEEFRTGKSFIEDDIANLEKTKHATIALIRLTSNNNPIFEKRLKTINMLIKKEKDKTPTPIDEYHGPQHIGFDKLFQIYLDDGRYDEAINLAHRAKDEKWAGNWDDRINRATRELNKTE